MFNRIDSHIDYRNINTHSSFNWNDTTNFDTLLSELNKFIGVADSSLDNNLAHQKLTIDHVREYNLLISIFRETNGKDYNECSSDFLSNVLDKSDIAHLDFLKGLIDKNLEAYSNICRSLKETAIVHNVLLNYKYLEKIFLARMQRRITVIPPVYRYLTNLKMATSGLKDAEMKYNDIFHAKMPLLINRPFSIEKKRLSTSTNDCHDHIETSIWDDNIVKKIIDSKDVDIVINLDTFVKLILASLNEIKEDYHIPFLKIKVKSGDRYCIIFDKVMYNTVDIEKERTNILKRHFSKDFSNSVYKNCKLRKRMENGHIRLINLPNRSLDEFQTKESNNELAGDIKDCFSLQSDSGSVVSGDLVIDDVSDERSHDIDDVKIPAHSYGMWKILDRNVLFRYGYVVRSPSDTTSLNEVESIYYQMVFNKPCKPKSNSEELWRTLIGSKLRLNANILRIIIDEEREIVENISEESLAEFLIKNPMIQDKFSTVLSAVANLFSQLQNESIEPDFYCLQLTSTDMHLLRSIDVMTDVYLDFRQLYGQTSLMALRPV